MKIITAMRSGFSRTILNHTFAVLLLAALAAGLATAATAQTFPLTIEHKFGTTVIPEKPERVASIDHHGGAENLLALGVQPVTIRKSLSVEGVEFTGGPWAETLLTTTPVLFEGEIDLEAIAGAEPDVIIALYSGIDQDMYEKLSLIAPVVAVPDGVGDYALGWQQQALLAARAVGEEAEAKRRIAAIDEKIATIASAHPEWAEMTAVVGGLNDGSPYGYTRNDGRAGFIYAMGFSDTPGMAELTIDSSVWWLDLSPEKLDVIDADIVVHYGYGASVLETLDEPARKFLKAYETGGEIYLTEYAKTAILRKSLLSIPVAADALVPMLEAAADGDPETPVPDARQ